LTRAAQTLPYYPPKIVEQVLTLVHDSKHNTFDYHRKDTKVTMANALLLCAFNVDFLFQNLQFLLVGIQKCFLPLDTGYPSYATVQILLHCHIVYPRQQSLLCEILNKLISMWSF